jgi:hypothetical protein
MDELSTHPRRERPSRHGVILGQTLAALADAGRREDPSCPDPCATCAFRLGCMTNMMAATGIEALNCSIGIDDSLFGCHHGMKDGEPTKLCAGWVAAKLAPFDMMKAELIRLGERLDAATGPDEIRQKFDEWVARVDPENRLNDYERGHLFLKATIP